MDDNNPIVPVSGNTPLMADGKFTREPTPDEFASRFRDANDVLIRAGEGVPDSPETSKMWRIAAATAKFMQPLVSQFDNLLEMKEELNRRYQKTTERLKKLGEIPLARGYCCEFFDIMSEAISISKEYKDPSCLFQVDFINCFFILRELFKPGDYDKLSSDAKSEFETRFKSMVSQLHELYGDMEKSLVRPPCLFEPVLTIMDNAQGQLDSIKRYIDFMCTFHEYFRWLFGQVPDPHLKALKTDYILCGDAEKNAMKMIAMSSQFKESAAPTGSFDAWKSSIENAGMSALDEAEEKEHQSRRAWLGLSTDRAEPLPKPKKMRSGWHSKWAGKVPIRQTILVPKGDATGRTMEFRVGKYLFRLGDARAGGKLDELIEEQKRLPKPNKVAFCNEDKKSFRNIKCLESPNGDKIDHNRFFKEIIRLHYKSIPGGKKITHAEFNPEIFRKDREKWALPAEMLQY